MDPRHSAQDVLRCTLCKTEVALMHCNVCYTHLCKDCLGIHFSDKSKVHTVVPIEQFLSTVNYPICPNHPIKQCELHCKQCNVHFCTSCISSGKHIGHKVVDIIEDFESKKEILKKDLQEIEKLVFPEYQKAALNIQVQKVEHRENSQKLATALKQQREALQKEIDIIVQRQQNCIDGMSTKHQTALDKQEKSINHTIAEIKQVIQDLKKLVDTNDICLVSKYQSRIEEFRMLPPKLVISIPDVPLVEINTEYLLKQFERFSSISIETDEQEYTLPIQHAETSPTGRSLLDVPLLITELGTGYDRLYNVSCLKDEQIWTRGKERVLKLYNLKGELVKSIETKSWNEPNDIAVTQSGELLYSDYHDRSINLASGTKIQRLVKLRGWKPHGVCSTLSSDILVIMENDDEKLTKVVRYSGSTKAQSIQWDDRGKPLYITGSITYICENRNLDICLADKGARAVVVISAAGKQRFRYNGLPSATSCSFEPRGITTDSRAKILIADPYTDCIHIVDQDGHFLRFIDSCGLQRPWGLCVDSKDNLFVAECVTGKIKKLQYYM